MRVEDLWVIFYLGLEFRAETLIPEPHSVVSRSPEKLEVV